MPRTKMWKIDLSEVPPDRRNDPRFIALYARLQSDLSDDRQIEAISIHEAAHLAYFTKAGSADFSIKGPRIVYGAQKDVFEDYGASVRFAGRDDAIISRLSPNEWVYLYSLGCAAGGVAARKLASAADGGDGDDFDNLRHFCTKISSKNPGVILDPIVLWETAQKDVSMQLDDKVRCDYVRGAAKMIDDLLSQESEG
jgi:hypothetical protein